MTTDFLEFTMDARVAPLGLRFWDPIMSRFVREGLRVTAHSVRRPTQKVQAVPNPSGVYVFHHLPGLRQAESGAGDAGYWQNLPQTGEFVVEVEEIVSGSTSARPLRYLPLELTVTAPFRGVYEWPLSPDVAIPDLPQGAIPLFSVGARSVPTGFGVIRAELWDPTAPALPGAKELGRPAAWAVLRANVDGVMAVFGIADDRGVVAIVFPYPEHIPSPPSSTHLEEQTWPVELSAQYQLAPGVIPTHASFPDVFEQPAVSLLPRWSGVPSLPTPGGAEILHETLKHGEELVLSTEGAPQGRVLYVNAQ